MEKVLVHLHLYYQDQLLYFLEKLKSINNCTWDLIVTVCEHNEETKQKILDFKPDAQIIIVKNQGYDILPFLNVLKSINLDDYDFVLKLHTKGIRNDVIVLNERPFYGSFWLYRLVDSLLFSEELFNLNLEILKTKEYGMIADSFFFMKLLNFPEDTYLLEDLKQKLNIKSNFNYFLAGSMFFIKASILKRLTDYDFSTDLISESKTGAVGTIFHAVERIFTILTDDEGYEIYKVPLF